MVNVDLYSAIITKVSNALNTLVSGEKPGFQTLPKGLVVLLCAEVVRQRVPDHRPCIALFHHRRPLYAWNLASNFFTRLDQLTHYVATLNYTRVVTFTLSGKRLSGKRPVTSEKRPRAPGNADGQHRVEHSNSGKKVSNRFDSRYRIDFFRFDSAIW